MIAIRYHGGMPAVHIRDVPEEDLRALKRRAKENHRSLQGELRLILRRAAAQGSESAADRLELITVESAPNADWSRAAIYGDDER